MNSMSEYNEQNSRCPRCGFSEEEMNGAQKLPEDILKPETVLQGRFVIGRPLSCSDYSFVYLAWDGVRGHPGIFPWTVCQKSWK